LRILLIAYPGAGSRAFLRGPVGLGTSGQTWTRDSGQWGLCLRDGMTYAEETTWPARRGVDVRRLCLLASDTPSE
jgi:hypothetical protein